MRDSEFWWNTHTHANNTHTHTLHSFQPFTHLMNSRCALLSNAHTFKGPFNYTKWDTLYHYQLDGKQFSVDLNALLTLYRAHFQIANDFFFLFFSIRCKWINRRKKNIAEMKRKLIYGIYWWKFKRNNELKLLFLYFGGFYEDSLNGWPTNMLPKKCFVYDMRPPHMYVCCAMRSNTVSHIDIYMYVQHRMRRRGHVITVTRTNEYM